VKFNCDDSHEFWWRESEEVTMNRYLGIRWSSNFPSRFASKEDFSMFCDDLLMEIFPHLESQWRHDGEGCEMEFQILESGYLARLEQSTAASLHHRSSLTSINLISFATPRVNEVLYANLLPTCNLISSSNEAISSSIFCSSCCGCSCWCCEA
jgi:hypothetical protein